MEGGFSIPVCIFVFKRKDTLERIFQRIRTVRPLKMYILSDGPRNEEEKEQVRLVRLEVERLIDWECKITKNYSEDNRGVYANVGLGAKWVLEREASAIFLEDDNLPESTFFRYCEELLNRYKSDTRIMWICGSNYLTEYYPEDGASYMFTKHMLPCGWATWSDKFMMYYDGELELFQIEEIQKKVKAQYKNVHLYRQQYLGAVGELYRIKKGEKFSSWDYQMAISIREHGVYGIVPVCNQIRNIGVDEFSIHGGTSFSNVMTRRFCEKKTKPMSFPLTHPKVVLPDWKFEKMIESIILQPLSLRIKGEVVALIKCLFGIPRYEHFTLLNVKKFFKGKGKLL